MHRSKLSHTAAMISSSERRYVYGFSVMEMTGLPSGTVYPAMRRLERDELIRSQWEQQSIADAEQRPPRKYYKLTRAGKVDAGGIAKAVSVAGKANSVGGGGSAMTLRPAAAFHGVDLAILAVLPFLCRGVSAGNGGGSGDRNCGMSGRRAPLHMASCGPRRMRSRCFA